MRWAGGKPVALARPRHRLSEASSGRRSGAMSQSRRSLQDGGPVPAGLEFAAALLPLWGFPAGADIAPADEQGTNNRTFLVRHGQQRYVLRVSGFLSVAEVRAEHRILLRLRQGDLPFQVPEPVAAPDGQTVIGTPAGPAAVCRWLPGVRPGMDGEAAADKAPSAPAKSSPNCPHSLRRSRTEPSTSTRGLCHLPKSKKPGPTRSIRLSALFSRRSPRPGRLLPYQGTVWSR